MNTPRKLLFEVWSIGVQGKLTDVRMCHGSRKRQETKIQRMYVERSETIRVKKIELVNNSERVNFPSESWSLTDSMVMKMEAKVKYLEQAGQPSPCMYVRNETYTMMIVQKMTILKYTFFVP